MRRSLSVLATAAVVVVAAASGASADRSPTALQGEWQQTARVTQTELVAGGMPEQFARTAPRIDKPGLRFEGGRFRVLDLASAKTIAAGSYTVRGPSVKVVFSSPASAPYARRVFWIDWQVYRDRLVFSRTPGRELTALLPWVIHPWRRIQ